jgi:hypothetical protein
MRSPGKLARLPISRALTGLKPGRQLHQEIGLSGVSYAGLCKLPVLLDTIDYLLAKNDFILLVPLLSCARWGTG